MLLSRPGGGLVVKLLPGIAVPRAADVAFAATSATVTAAVRVAVAVG